ncbi:glycosyltransferase [Kocuria rosea]|nr:glycosyltransferase family 4 protein [Kocuria rosea]THE19448.1 glycosyltransferase [Kocuria rosea]
MTDLLTKPTTTAVFVTATEPEPRTFGKQVVVGGLLDHLCSRLGADNVHVILIGHPRHDRPATPYHLHLIPKPSTSEQVRAVLERVVLPPWTSLQEAALWSPRVLLNVEELLSGLHADLEIWDTMRTGQYAQRLPRRRRVLYADDLFSKRYASMLRQIRNQQSRIDNPLGEFGKLLPGPAARLASHPWVYRPLLSFEQKRTAQAEDRAPRDFDATLLVNADETAELSRRTGWDSIRTVLPLLPASTSRPRDFQGESVFVFLGGLDFAPNRHGLAWFLANCRETVLTALPDFRLLVVGRNTERLPPEAAHWGQHVQPLGWVEDLDEVLLTSAAMISPLQIGSGTKIKVLEALSRGLPVVATPQGVLGLQVDRSDGCLVAESPAQIAALLSEAVDPPRNRLLSEAAKSSWIRRFAAPVVRATYDDLLGLASSATKQNTL